MRHLMKLTAFTGAMIALLSTAAAAQPDAKEATAPSEESIEIQLARAHVQLAELDLRRALEVNKRVPNTFPPEVVEVFRLHVTADRAHLEGCLSGKAADPHEALIRRAETALAFAEANLKRTQKINELMPSDANALNVERATVVARIAELHLEDTKQLDSPQSTIAHMQRQIDELRHQVLQIRLRLAASQ